MKELISMCWGFFKKRQKPLSEMGFQEFQEYLRDLFKRVEAEVFYTQPPMELLKSGRSK